MSFESKYFQKLQFTQSQIDQYINAAERDLTIARGSDIPEVIFRFSYDALIKLGIAVIAGRGYKVSSRAGHHMKILEKMAQILDNSDIEVMGNKMRQDRNRDLYDGGILVSEKDANEYMEFVKRIFNSFFRK